jgi:hypothetical protein
MPLAGVVLDKEGNVFGASQAMNGQLPCGTVFELTASNGYAQTILHEFEGTFHNNDGTIFKLTRETSGFSYKVLYSFLGDQIGSTDGEFPVAPLTFGPDGALFSTSLGPGFPAGGEAFRFIP